MKPILLTFDFPVHEKNVLGITIWPFICINKKNVPELEVPLLRHETLHWNQARNWFVIPWYVAYFATSAWLMLLNWSFDAAYDENPFEVYAYVNENNDKILPAYLEEWVKANAKV